MLVLVQIHNAQQLQKSHNSYETYATYMLRAQYLNGAQQTAKTVQYSQEFISQESTPAPLT